MSWLGLRFGGYAAKDSEILQIKKHFDVSNFNFKLHTKGFTRVWSANCSFLATLIWGLEILETKSTALSAALMAWWTSRSHDPDALSFLSFLSFDLFTSFYIILHHFTSFYIILHHFTSFYIILHHFTSFYIILHHFTSFYIILHHFTSFYIILHHFTSFYIILHHFTSFYIILHHFTSFYIILHHFTSFYIILHHFTSFYIILHHFASFCIILHHFASFYIILHHFTSFYIILHHFTSFYIILHHFTSFYIILHHFTSFYIILHHFTSAKNDDHDHQKSIITLSLSFFYCFFNSCFPSSCSIRWSVSFSLLRTTFEHVWRRSNLLRSFATLSVAQASSCKKTSFCDACIKRR